MTPLQKYDYAALLRHPQAVIKTPCFPQKPVFLHIVIGTMGRNGHLHTCLRYLESAVKYCNAITDFFNMDIAVTVVETNQQPSADLDGFFDNPFLHLNYLFVPLSALQTENKFSRGLAFDLGFISFQQKIPWVMNMDSDLLVPHDFFVKLKKHIDSFPVGQHKHIQPYCGRRVRRATQHLTNLLLNSPVKDLYAETDYTLPNPGACGGAIVLHRDHYIAIGGYDEYFYDWAPEDQLFFLKLECLYGMVNTLPDAHKGNACYAEDLFLLHLEHEKLWDKNPRLAGMEKIYQDFCSLSYADKMNYIGKKSELFNRQMTRYNTPAKCQCDPQTRVIGFTEADGHYCCACQSPL